MGFLGSAKGKTRTTRFAKNAGGFLALFIAGVLCAGAFATVVVAGGTTSSSTATDTLAASTTDTTTIAAPTSSAATTTDSTPTPTDPTTTTDPSTTASAAALAPTISTDKGDYAPGSTVTLTGGGWGSGESVHVVVNDTIGQTWSYATDVTSDMSGGFSFQVQLPNYFVSDYDVTATGATGEIAKTTFTDAVNAKFAGTDGVDHASLATEQNLGTFTQGTAITYANTPCTFQTPGNLQVKVTGLGSTQNLSWALAYGTSGASNATLVGITTLSPASDTIPGNGNGVECVGLSIATTTLAAGTYHGQLRWTQTGGASAGTDFPHDYFFSFTITSASTSTSIARTTGAASNVYGDALTYTATVTASPSNPTSGSVTFKDGASTICDAVPLSGTNNATCSPKLLVGTGHSVTATYNPVGSFTTSTSSALAQTITARPLTASFSVSNKIYDATTSATVATSSLSNQVTGDDISLSGATAAFIDKNVGTGKTVNVTGYSLTGGDASNYSLTNSSATASANITQRTLTATATGANKQYDGTTSASVSLSSDRIAGDSVTLAYMSASFADRNVGTAKTINVSGISITGGTDAGDYALGNTNATATGNIKSRPLTVSATGVNKVYDATTAATVNLSSDKLGSDAVTASYTSAAFDNKNVGTGKIVNVGGISISGGDSTNYALQNTTASTSAKITARGLTIAATSDTRSYNATTASSAVPTTSGLQGATDSVTASESFDSPNAGARTLNVDSGYAVADGNGGNNYTVTLQSAAGTITPAALDLYASTDTKDYDATTSSSATPTHSALVGGDTISGLTQSFQSKNVLGANGSTLAVNSGYVINDGNSGNNYAVTKHTATGTITERRVDIFAAADSKTYDGTTGSTATPTYSGLQTGDTITGLAQVFGSKNVLGTDGSTLNVTAYTVNDANGGNNYAVALHSAAGTISKRTLDINAVTESKTYDGTTSSTTAPTYTGLQAGDSLTGLAESYDSKNAGIRMLAVNADYTLTDGNGGANYDVQAHSASGTISPRALDIYATPDTKNYDGTAASAAVPTWSGLGSGDSFTTLTQAFDSKNVGTRVLSVTYTIADSNGGNNYTVTTHTTSGAIDAVTLDIYAASDSRLYDGTKNSAGTPTYNGLKTGDSVSGLAQAFASKNVLGTNGSTLNVTAYTVNDGNSGNNYTVALHSAVGTISKRTLDITASSDSKTYDGMTSSTATPTDSGLQTGDSLTGLTESYDTKNAGTRILSVDGGYTLLDDNLGGNYDVQLHTAAGTISRQTLDLYAVTDSKTYDGTRSSAATPTYAGLQDGDSLAGLTQRFDSKNAGNRTLSVNDGYTLTDGNSGNNYDVQKHNAPGTIGQAPLDIYATPDTKNYDGTTTSTATPTSNGLQTVDSFTTLTQAFDSRNAGSRTLSVTYVIDDGNGGDNYSVTTHDATGAIDKVTLDIYAATDSKQYDATTASSAAPTTAGVQTGDSVSGLSQAFESKNVLGTNGSTLAITAYTVHDGNSGGNYTVALHKATGTITQAPATVSATSQTRVYDASASSSATPTASGLFTGDTLVSATQVFDSANVGNRTLSVTSYVIADGNGGGNYDVSLATATGSITARHLDIYAATDSKTYDGTTSSTGTPTVSGLQGHDSVTGRTQAFESKNVLGTGGSTLQVTAYTVNDENGGNNYSVEAHIAAGTITPHGLDIYATADSKTYDGTTASTATPTTSGVQTGDSVTGLAQAFQSKNVLGANGSTLEVTQYTVNDGNSGGNYAVTKHSATGTISQAILDIYASAQARQYDGTTTSSATPTTSGVQTGDTVTNLTQAFASRHVAGPGGSIIAVTGWTMNDGNNGGNYSVVTHAAFGTINPAPLRISATSDSKVYDGTTASAAAPTYGTVYTPDSVTGLSQAFVSKNVLGANGSTLVVTGYTVNDGNGGQDYTVTKQPASGTITPASLGISAVADIRGYDGTTHSAGTPLVGTTYNGDTVTGLAQEFASKDVLGANGSTINVTAYTVNDGNGGADYTIHTHGAQGTITPANLDISAVADTKVYDGTTSSNKTPTVGKLYGSDTVTGLVQAFGSRHVLGAGNSTLGVTGYVVNDGNSGHDYTVSPHTAMGTITAADLDIYAVGDSKVYDGNMTSSKTPSVGTLYNASDSVTGIGQAFVSKNVMGTNGSTLFVTSFVVNDGNGGADYNVHTHTAAGTITPRTLDISAVADAKAYDGTTSSSQTPTYAGLQSGDSLTGLSQSFDSKNAGGRTLSVNGGYSLVDGNGGGDYSVVLHTAAGSIMPRETSVALADSPSPSAWTQAFTLTATVTGTPSAPNPASGDGTVLFYDGGACSGTVLATVALDANGQASYTVPAMTLLPGAHTVFACYSGGTNFQGNFTTKAHSINNNAPSVTLAAGNTLSVNEGATQTFTFSITDTDAGDSWSFVTGSPTCGTNNQLVSSTINPDGTGSFQCKFVDGLNPAGTNPISVQVRDAFGATSGTATQNVAVSNLAPAVSSFSGQNVLSGPLVNGLTGTFTYTFSDAGVNDKNWVARFNWGGYADSVTQTDATQGTFNARPQFQSGGCSQTATVSVTDKDGDTGMFTSAPVKVGTGSFLPPMTNQPVTDQLKNGQVLPVKVLISDCNGTAITGLSPAISLKAGDLTDANDNTTDAITPTSVSSADTTGIMRPAGDGSYIYNMKVQIPLNTAYTVIITPNISGYASTLTLRHKIIATK